MEKSTYAANYYILMAQEKIVQPSRRWMELWHSGILVLYARGRVADRTIRLPEDIIGHCYYPVQIIYCDNYLRRRVDQVQRLLCSFFLGTQTKAFTDSLARLVINILTPRSSSDCSCSWARIRDHRLSFCIRCPCLSVHKIICIRLPSTSVYIRGN